MHKRLQEAPRSIDETAQTAVPFADRTDRTNELDEIAAVESAVDEP